MHQRLIRPATRIVRLTNLLVLAGVFVCAHRVHAETEKSDEPRRLAERSDAVDVVDLDAMVDEEGFLRDDIAAGEIVGGQIVDGGAWSDVALNDGELLDPWDAYQDEQASRLRNGCLECLPNINRPKSWQILPEGLIYHSYLAGAKEPRFSTQWLHEKNEGWLADTTLGGRVGLLRYGTEGPAVVQGFQVDFEGAVMLRQDLDLELDVVAMDFRGGLPVTFGFGRYQTKLAYYHLSSHLGDEFMLKNPVTRINFSRDVLVWGNSYFLTDDLRIYGEVGWAFYSNGGSDPWEIQFGIDYSPACALGPCGAPYFALNGHLRQEVDFGGNFVAQAGWQWRRVVGGPRFRFGAQYYNGKSSQYEFFDTFEQQLGLGFWYDF